MNLRRSFIESSWSIVFAMAVAVALVVSRFGGLLL